MRVTYDILQVDLPIDPTIVLLDIGFTGTDPNHGEPPLPTMPGGRFFGTPVSGLLSRMRCWSRPVEPFRLLTVAVPCCFCRESCPAVSPAMCNIHVCGGAPGFLLGSRQTLLETKDGGKSWEPRTVAAAQVFRILSCLARDFRAESLSRMHGDAWLPQSHQVACMDMLGCYRCQLWVPKLCHHS